MLSPAAGGSGWERSARDDLVAGGLATAPGAGGAVRAGVAVRSGAGDGAGNRVTAGAVPIAAPGRVAGPGRAGAAVRLTATPLASRSARVMSRVRTAGMPDGPGVRRR